MTIPTFVLFVYSLLLFLAGGLLGGWSVVKWLDRRPALFSPVAARRWWKRGR